jgi:hypothetical protein
VDSKHSIGLVITLALTGFGFMFISEYIGIGFFVLAGVLGILFVNPKSPIRSRCWSVGNKLGVTIIRPATGNRQSLTVYEGLRALSPIRVDKIRLSIGRKKIIADDWESHEVAGDESRYIYFDRPKWLYSGEYSARLIAYTPEGYSKSDKFTLRVKD